MTMEQFAKTCRSCAYQSDELIAIGCLFEDLETPKNKTVADVLKECVDIKVIFESN